MIPFGAIASLIPAAISGFTKLAESKDQLFQAGKYRNEASKVKKEPLRPEFQQALAGAEQRRFLGLPSLPSYLSQIDNSVANSARTITETSPDGASSLNAITAALIAGNKDKTNLLAKDAEAQLINQQGADQMLWNVGQQQRQLELAQKEERNRLLSQAANLEAAGLENKMKATDQLLTTATKGVNEATKVGLEAGKINYQLGEAKEGGMSEEDLKKMKQRLLLGI